MVNQELLDYIRQQTEAGFSREEVASALMTGGWTGEDINEAYATLYPPATSPEVSAGNDVHREVREARPQASLRRDKKKDNSSVVVGAIMATLVFAVGFYFLMRSFSGSDQVAESIPEVTADVEMNDDIEGVVGDTDGLSSSEASTGGLDQEELSLLQEVVGDQIELANNLKDCTPYSALHLNFETGERDIEKEIRGMIDGKCHYIEDMGGPVMTCAYSDGYWTTVAESIIEAADAELHGSDVSTSNAGGEDVFAAAIDRGDCTVDYSL